MIETLARALAWRLASYSLAGCLVMAAVLACSKEPQVPASMPAEHANPRPEQVLSDTDPKDSADTTSSEAARLQVNSVLPQSAAVDWVLDGTDLRKNMAAGKLGVQSAVQWSGAYRSEQGGSVLDVRIDVDPEGGWRLSRRYAEPGLKAQEKSYQLRSLDDGLASREAGVAVKKTAEGVLVLELNSGVDSIPASYWVHYLRVK